MPFGLANARSVYSRMLDVAMKEVERDFLTSYLNDILTFNTFLTFSPGGTRTLGRWNQDTIM